MVKYKTILLIVHFFIFTGCVSTIETVEEAVPVPKVTAGMSKAEVINILSRPDFISASEDQTIFFFCTNPTTNTLNGFCTPILFQKDKVVEIGEKDSQKWPLDLVRWKIEKDREKGIVAESKKVKPSRSIKEETLVATKTYTLKEGAMVYVSYYTNFVRYVPIRLNPSNEAKILQTICIGTELDVLSAKDPWIQVKGVNDNYSGWVLKRWVTNDPTVKRDAEQRRKKNEPEIARLEAIVKPIPQSKWRKNLKLYEKLLELDPCNSYYQRKVDFYENYGRKRGRRKR